MINILLCIIYKEFKIENVLEICFIFYLLLISIMTEKEEDDICLIHIIM